MTTLSRAEPPIASAQGHYLYAVVDRAPQAGTLEMKGVDGSPVYLVSDGSIAAVVSDLACRRVRPERKRLTAHHDVLKQLMVDHTVLPMSFGLIAESENDIRRILRLNQTEFAQHFRKLQGKVEMGVRVAWDVPNVFELLVTAHPQLRLMRDHMFRNGREPSHDEKIELGHLFEALLASVREDAQERVSSVLERYCDEVVSNPPRNEREVMNLACLTDATPLSRFELGVVEAASRFDDHYTFDFSGPWPPHNFSKLELRTS